MPGRSLLAEPFELANGFVVPNRVVKAALSEGLATRHGAPGARIQRLYGRWASNGLGLNITGNVMIDRKHGLGEPGNVVVEDDRDFADIQAWAKVIKSGGARAFAQINHPGRQTPRTLITHPVAPSAVAIPGTGGAFAKPRELTHAEILDIIERFANTARILVEAGFDGVQIHGAHGYLISQFLSPLSNQRTDDWGGTPEKRRRFVLEVFRAMRAAVGPDVPVTIKLNSADFQKGGFTEEESLEVVRALAAEGLDMLEISGGTYTSAAMLGVDDSLKESTRKREAYFLTYAQRVRAEVPDLPLMLTGGFRTADGMAEAIASGDIDFVGLGRPLAVGPDFPADLLAGRTDESVVSPRRSGIRLLDNLTELTYYSVQMWRMAAGKEPAPNRHSAINVVQYIIANGIGSVRSPRA